MYPYSVAICLTYNTVALVVLPEQYRITWCEVPACRHLPIVQFAKRSTGLKDFSKYTVDGLPAAIHLRPAWPEEVGSSRRGHAITAMSVQALPRNNKANAVLHALLSSYLRRSGKTSILNVVLDDIEPNSTLYNESTREAWTKRFKCTSF